MSLTASTGCGDTHSLRRPCSVGATGLTAGRVCGTGPVSSSLTAGAPIRLRRAGTAATATVKAPPLTPAASGAASARSCPAPSPTGPGGPAV